MNSKKIGGSVILFLDFIASIITLWMEITLLLKILLTVIIIIIFFIAAYLLYFGFKDDKIINRETAREIREDEQKENTIKEHFQKILINCVNPLCSIHKENYGGKIWIYTSFQTPTKELSQWDGEYKEFYSHIRDTQYRNMKNEIDSLYQNVKRYNNEIQKENRILIDKEIETELNFIRDKIKTIADTLKIVGKMEGVCEVEEGLS